MKLYRDEKQNSAELLEVLNKCDTISYNRRKNTFTFYAHEGALLEDVENADNMDLVKLANALDKRYFFEATIGCSNWDWDDEEEEDEQQEEPKTEEPQQEGKNMRFKKDYFAVTTKKIDKYNAIRFDSDIEFYVTNCTEAQEPDAIRKAVEKFVDELKKHGGAEILVDSLEMSLRFDEIGPECTFNEIRNGGNAFEIEINRGGDTDLFIYIRICEHQDAPTEETAEEPAADQEPEEETATLKNYDEIRETLIETIADLETRKNRYQTDIYLYIDENGHGTIDTFVNVGGNSWLNDDHIKIYTDREHCETKLDDLQNGDGRGAWNWLIDELENTYNLTGIKEKIYNSCCDDDDEEPSFKSFDDLEPYDIEKTLYALYCDEIDSYYRDYFIPDCCIDYISEYADQALEEYR